MDNFSNKLSEDIFKYVTCAAQELGTDAYVVGGYVRDLLLQRESKDIDIVTSGNGLKLALATAQKANIPADSVTLFKTYGTAMFRYQGIEVEFVGARKESYSSHSRNPKVESGTLEDDQNRRDFTINAMAISLNDSDFGDFFDPFNGLSDLNHKLIKTPLDPVHTFTDDPLRIMRGIRFAAQLGFSVEKETLIGMKTKAERLSIISKERIAEELHKILLSHKPSKGFLLLDEVGILDYILPALVRLKGVETINRQSHKDNFLHTLEVVDSLSLNSQNLWLLWAALLHDVGKADTKKYLPETGWTFHQHEVIGSKMVPKIFRSLRMPLNEKMEYVKKMVFLHLRPIALVEDVVTDSAIRRLLFDAGDDIDDLMLLCEADITSKNQAKVFQYLTNFEMVRQKLADIEEKDRIRNFQPPIDGDLIMNLFNLVPCREVGLIKNAIREAILEGEVANDYQVCYQFMLNYAKNELGLQPKTDI
ncbi:MAG: CCA tRNA nucleotidyltransferase [Bacteroidales bacterium]|nr:CCA tRNA nucleotidyltransferase [Bacteroidales bacterium]